METWMMRGNTRDTREAQKQLEIITNNQNLTKVMNYLILIALVKFRLHDRT